MGRGLRCTPRRGLGREQHGLDLRRLDLGVAALPSPLNHLRRLYSSEGTTKSTLFKKKTATGNLPVQLPGPQGREVGPGHGHGRAPEGGALSSRKICGSVAWPRNALCPPPPSGFLKAQVEESSGRRPSPGTPGRFSDHPKILKAQLLCSLPGQQEGCSLHLCLQPSPTPPTKEMPGPGGRTAPRVRFPSRYLKLGFRLQAGRQGRRPLA